MRSKTAEKILNKTSDDVKERVDREVLIMLENYDRGFLAHRNKTEKILKDLYNKYNSWYQQQTQTKLGRTPNFKYETELLAKIDLLQEIKKKLEL